MRAGNTLASVGNYSVRLDGESKVEHALTVPDTLKEPSKAGNSLITDYLMDSDVGEIWTSGD